MFILFQLLTFQISPFLILGDASLGNTTASSAAPVVMAEETVAEVAETTSSLGGMQGAQLWMVAGFLILGWVLARRQMKMGKRVNREARAANKELEKVRQHRDPVLPLADAPPETQRWQVALFDLQRELKAELDTRIAVVQTLIRQVDQRIEHLETLESSGGRVSDGQVNGGRGSGDPQTSAEFRQLERTIRKQ